jgi:hypothetical protein
MATSYRNYLLWQTTVLQGDSALADTRGVTYQRARGFRERKRARSSRGAGGATNSEPEAEFQETGNKSKPMLKGRCLG